jgi:regulatory protein
LDINPKIIRQIESYCAYQDRSRKEVEIKLIQLGALPNQKLSVLIRLELQGFLDDERFAKSFVRGKFKQKKWGLNKIKNQLKLKGIDSKLIQLAIQEIENDDYNNTINILAEKKWLNLKDENLFKRKEKVAKYLLSKGYESNIVFELVKNLKLN